MLESFISQLYDNALDMKLQDMTEVIKATI